MDLSEKSDKEFGDKETVFLSHAASPIVVPATSTTVRSDVTTGPTEPADQQKVLLGHRQLLAGDYDGAIQAYTEAINLNSNNAAAFDGRGDAFARKDDLDSAINDWQNAVSLDPKRAQTLEPMIEQAKRLQELNKK